MDVLKLRSTGFKYVNQCRPITQKLQRERRNTKLRDLIVARVIKHIRLNEISKITQRNRDINRENTKESSLSIQRELAPIILDKDFEEIARLEVDTFMNQGKILTDK
jgi:hypothetical protein